MNGSKHGRARRGWLPWVALGAALVVGGVIGGVIRGRDEVLGVPVE
jgi:hypothetical protein